MDCFSKECLRAVGVLTTCGPRVGARTPLDGGIHYGQEESRQEGCQEGREEGLQEVQEVVTLEHAVLNDY